VTFRYLTRSVLNSASNSSKSGCAIDTTDHQSAYQTTVNSFDSLLRGKLREPKVKVFLRGESRRYEGNFPRQTVPIFGRASLDEF